MEKKVIFKDREVLLSSYPELEKSILVRELIENRPEEDISLHNFEGKYLLPITEYESLLSGREELELISKHIIFWSALDNVESSDMWLSLYFRVLNEMCDTHNDTDREIFLGSRQIINDFNGYPSLREIYFLYEFYYGYCLNQNCFSDFLSEIKENKEILRIFDFVKNSSHFDTRILLFLFRFLKDDNFSTPHYTKQNFKKLLEEYSSEKIEVEILASGNIDLLNLIFEVNNPKIVVIILPQAGVNSLSLFSREEFLYPERLTLINLKLILKKTFIQEIIDRLRSGSVVGRNLIKNFHPSLVIFLYGKISYDSDVGKMSSNFSEFFYPIEDALSEFLEKI